MKISYGKNVYGKEEIKAVVTQLKKTTQMSVSVKNLKTRSLKFLKKNIL